MSNIGNLREEVISKLKRGDDSEETLLANIKLLNEFEWTVYKEGCNAGFSLAFEDTHNFYMKMKDQYELRQQRASGDIVRQ